MKAVSWCEKRLRTPQLVVLGICVLFLLPVVLFIAFLSALNPSHCLLLLLSMEQVLLPAATKLCMTAI